MVRLALWASDFGDTQLQGGFLSVAGSLRFTWVSLLIGRAVIHWVSYGRWRTTSPWVPGESWFAAMDGLLHVLARFSAEGVYWELARYRATDLF